MKPAEPPTSRTGLRWLLASILLIGLLVTALAVQNAKTQIDRSVRREFDFVCSEIQEKIVDRLSAHEQILRSGAAFFAHASDLTRAEWQGFVAQQKIEQHLPGTQGLGFEVLIPRARLAQHIQEIRAAGFPDYRVWPEGDRDVYSAVLYLEPFTNRNCRVLGYDGLSEPVRRAALERARDEGAAALSGKVQLVQEAGQDIQAGTVLYVPVYHPGMPTGTVDQRRAALRGWVYSPYRMTDLLHGILGQAELVNVYSIHLKIFDGQQVSAAALLYDSQPAATQPSGGSARLSLQQSLVFAGRHWTLQYTTISDQTAYGMVWLVVLGGTSLTLLLVGFIFNLLNTRFKAEQIARQLSQELLASVEQHRTIIQTAMDGYWVTDLQGQLLEVNAAYCQMSGYSLPELLALGVANLEVDCAAAAIAARIQKVVAQGEDRFESRHRRKDRSVFDVEISIQYQPAKGGRLVAFLRDITARKQAEAELRESEYRWKYVIEGSGDGLWDWNTSAGTVFFSKRWKEMLGLADDEIGNHLDEWSKRVHPDDLAPALAAVQAHLDGTTPHYLSEHRIRCKDGSWKWILARGLVVNRDAAGKPLRMIGTHSDITARRLAAVELVAAKELAQQKMAFLESILESPKGVIIFALDRQYRYTEFTPLHQTTMRNIWGREIAVGLNMLDVISAPVDREKAKANFDRVLSGEHLQIVEEYGASSSHERRFYENRYSPIFDKSGPVVGLTVFVIDITARKQAEAELQEKEESYRTLADSGMVLIWTSGLDKKCDYFNQPWLKFTGRTLDQELGDGWAEGVHPDDLARCFKIYTEAFDRREKFSMDYRLRRHDGEFRWIQDDGTPRHDSRGDFLGYIGHCLDITERQQAEAARLTTEQRYRSYFELPLVGLAITSPEKGWLEVNDRLCSMLGYSRAELLGMTWAELTVPADLAADVVQFERLMAGEIEAYQLEKRFVHKAGQFITTELAVQCVRTATGAVDYIVALIQDISERKRALAELQQAQQQLMEQERLRVVGQLAAGIAHDFNNTLSPIVGFSEILLKDPAKRADPALLMQWLQFIHTAATDAASVVRQIRELSHAPAPDARLVSVDLNQLIQRTIASTQPRWKDQAQAEGRTLNIVAQCGPIPLVTGEEYALREAVMNLLFNAVDFTPNGGTITLGTAVDGEFVRCWVSDTGAGMTEETRQHCLEPFFTTKGPAGTGLGLAMVQSIVQRYGGTVAITSALGQGTTVTLRLPIPSVPPVALTRDVAPSVSQVLRVLVVDDEPLLCVLVEAWLLVGGHSVVTAASGAAALQRLQVEPFDLVITDKAMPQMSGEQLAAAIQAVAPALPVILMTGFGDLMKADGKMPPHIRAILSKPITEESLRAALATVFPE